MANEVAELPTMEPPIEDLINDNQKYNSPNSQHGEILTK